MKLKISEIKELVDGLNEIVQKEMNISLSFKVKRNAMKINDEVKIISEMRESIVEKYDLENAEEHNKALEELDELNNQEVDIELQMLSVSELEESNISVKPSVLANLEPIITDDNEWFNDGEEE